MRLVCQQPCACAACAEASAVQDMVSVLSEAERVANAVKTSVVLHLALGIEPEHVSDYLDGIRSAVLNPNKER